MVDGSALARAVGSTQVRTVPAVAGVLIDNSGSMSGYGDVIEKAMNGLVKQQQAIKGKATLILSEFSDRYVPVLKDEFTNIKDGFYKFHVVGGTCLYNSIVDMADDMENKIAKMDKDPNRKVVLGIITDGEDSGCRGAGLEGAKKAIAQKLDKGWEVLFFGTADSAIRVAKDLGISSEKAAGFVDRFGTANVDGALNLLSDKVAQARSKKGANLAITDAERLALGAPSDSRKREL